mmetsp:Transcript_19293/g.39283  ORF Transcript_19293/g.39283 Transcript_19293/m.39283 type:complete len:86 (+) Transcript_19293:2390-2647(+)
MKLNEVFKKIKNEIITVELKTGIIIQGILIEIDKSMNLFLKSCKRISKKGKPVFVSEIAIRGSSIRYIILPIWLNIETLLSFEAL